MLSSIFLAREYLTKNLHNGYNFINFMITIYDDDIDHGMAMVDYNDSLVLNRKLYSHCMTKFICVNDTAERNLMLNFFSCRT